MSIANSEFKLNERDENKMNLTNLKLDFINKNEYIVAYIETLMKSKYKNIKECLAAMDLPASSYNYCKTNGFNRSYSTLDIIGKHFSVNFEYSNELYKKLESLVNRSITECFYVEGKTKELREELYRLEDQCKNSILYPIYVIIYISLLDLPDQIERYKDLIPNHFVPLMNRMYSSLPEDFRYLYTDMLSQYYMVTDEVDKYRTICAELLILDEFVDERLKTLGYYDMMTLYYCLGDTENSLNYLHKSEQLYLKYFNARRLNYLNKNKAAISFRCKRYEEAAIAAKNNLIYISRDETRPIVYKQTINIYVSSLIMLGKYQEALEGISLFYENEFEDYYVQAELFTLYCLLKEKKYEDMNLHQAKILELLNNDEAKEGYILSSLIMALIQTKKKDMMEYGKKLKPIKLNSFNGFGQICSILTNEYEEYLKKGNKYIDVLDM